MRSPKWVFEAYENSDLFIMPSIIATDEDGLPNVQWRPPQKGVLYSQNLPGITEFIRHDETGWIVPSKNSKELTQHYKPSQDPAKRVRLAESANKLLATHFSHSKNVQDIIKLPKSDLDKNNDVIQDSI